MLDELTLNSNYLLDVNLSIDAWKREAAIAGSGLFLASNPCLTHRAGIESGFSGGAGFTDLPAVKQTTWLNLPLQDVDFELKENPRLEKAVGIGTSENAFEHWLWLSQQGDLAVTASINLRNSNPAASTLSGEVGKDIFRGVIGITPLVGQVSNDPLTNFMPSGSEPSTSPPVTNTNDNQSQSVLSNSLILSGTLRADRFTFQPGHSYTIISGNGNVDFGSEFRDWLDLSNISFNTVQFNWAETTGGGVLYNPGNGTRVFDALTLSDGSQILLEGLDSIQFSDRTLNLSVIPDDPLFDRQWNLHMMGVHNAWYFTKGSTNVLVGVEDSGLGVDANGYIHPDLGNTIFYPGNCPDDFSSFGTPKLTSHGTAVQGIIAAKSNNGIGMSGINWNSPVFNIDVLGDNSGDQSLAEATQNMIDYASSQGERLVINMSLGGGSPDSAFEQLIAKNQNNALFVMASGNEDASSISYPASLAKFYSNVIAVGASWGTHDQYGNPTTPGERISYPGYWGSNYGTGLTLMGPSEVVAPLANNTGQFNYWNRNNSFNGTSAATPNVAGVASLVWSVNPNLTATQVRQVMSDTAYDLGTPGYDPVYGYGFVNADAAVRRAMAIAWGVV
jgi:serine protease